MTLLTDQEVVAKLAEVDMIVADLERANSRVATVERRNVSGSSVFFRSLRYGIHRKFFVRRLRRYAVGTIAPIGKAGVALLPTSVHLATG